MGDLLQPVARFARRYRLFVPAGAVVVGVSGGPDSLCLLHLLRRLAPDFGLRLHVAHLNHGLRGAEAAADAAFVAQLATDWGLTFTIGQADVSAAASRPGVSLEEAARQARYAFLAQVAHETGAGVIAVGHNADDQAETVLMHFLRGSGLGGLRGMLPRTDLADYRLVKAGAGAGASAGAATPGELWLVRPLLATPRREIAAYCAENALDPRVDSSNADTTLYRNRLRHELLPLLERYNPEIRSVLGHTADVLAGDFDVVEGAVAVAWAQVARPAAADEVQLDLERWRGLPLGLQRATLRRAIWRLRRSLRNINWQHVEAAVWLAREGGTGQAATLTAGLELTIGYTTLRIAAEGRPWRGGGRSGGPGDVLQLAGPVPLAAEGVTPLPGGWRAVVDTPAQAEWPADPTSAGDPWTGWFDAAALGADLVLRRRAPGDRFVPLGFGGHHVRLTEYMINLKVPRDARAGWPLLVAGAGAAAGEIAWVCGLRVAAWAALTPITRAVRRVRLERAHQTEPTL